MVAAKPTTWGDLGRTRSHRWKPVDSRPVCLDCTLVFADDLWLADMPSCPGPDFILVTKKSVEALVDNVVRHKADLGAIRSVCGEDLDAAGNSIVINNIDDVSCVKCLRMLAKDAGRYGNGRRPQLRR